jgi:hypothetical protein
LLGRVSVVIGRVDIAVRFWIVCSENVRREGGSYSPGLITF